MYVKPAEYMREAFELAPELLVVVLPAQEAFAKDIQQAEALLSGKNLRLDAGLVLAFVRDESAADRLAAPVARTGRNYVFIDAQIMDEAVDPRKWLRTKLREQLGAADLFEPSKPVTGWDFFGRESELKRLRQYVVAGKPVGLYGLRKTGKTSLALRCLEQLGGEGSTVGVHIDLQALGIENSYIGFMRRLILSLGESFSRLKLGAKGLDIPPDFADREKLRRISDQEVQRQAVVALEATIDWASENPARRVLLFIDEYERLFEETIFPQKEALAVLDYLRGLVQTYPASFTFIIAGLSRRFAEQSRIGKRQNPLFNFAVDFPIAGLEHKALKDMFRKIGKRVGLKFLPESLELIQQQTGGHPALARKFGRLIDRRVPLDQRIDIYQVSHTMVDGTRPDFAIEAKSTMEEIYIACSDIGETVPSALTRLLDEPQALDSLAAEQTEQLRRLGIVEKVDDGWTLSIGCFAGWLRMNVDQARAAGT